MSVQKTYDSDHLKRVLLLIANEVKRICEKNNIQYSLDGGSLIGAVRHKGFIPWDDDFDIDMTRENYDRFIDACKKDLSEEFYLQTFETDINYPRGFCKVLLKNTDLIEPQDTKCKYKTGIFIDIFPWDNVPDNAILKYYQMFITYLCGKILLQQAGADIPDGGSAKKFVFQLIRFAGKIVSRRAVIQIRERYLMKYPNTTKKVACMVCVAGYKKTEMDRRVFDEYTTLAFEDTYYSVVKDYDYMLKKIFGNYMEIPPIEKRKSHNYISVDFGKY